MPFAVVTATSLDLGTKGFAFALEQSHLPGLLIAGVLLVLSILSWSVMASKIALMSRASQRNFRFFYAFRKTKDPLELHDKGFNLPGAPLFAVYRAGARELSIYLDQAASDAGLTPGGQIQARRTSKISPDQMGSVYNAMERCIGEAVLTFENRMNMLATAVSGAPFLGLLGTVWGVMETFSGIASTSSTASIRDMAPGVAAALVTTVIGLLVAIPAMFGHNFLVNRIRTTTLEMHNFASELASFFERDYVDFHQGASALPVPAPVAAAAPVYASYAAGPASHMPASQPAVSHSPYSHHPQPAASHLPAQAPLDVTAPIPLQVTAPVPLHRAPEPEGPSFGRNPAGGYPPPREGEHLWPPPAGNDPINPIAQQAAYQSQREWELAEQDRQRPLRPPLPVQRTPRTP